MKKKFAKKTISTPICLVGMPGAGKSVTGQKIATRLGVPFYDADMEIEIAANMPISELFAKYGEQHFRQGEGRVIKRLLSGKPCVIATGGGAFINDSTRHIIQTHAISVYLNVPFSTLWERVRDKSHRPLLEKSDGKQVLRRLYETRTPIYTHAHISVSYQNETALVNAERISNKILKYLDMKNATK